MPRKSLFYLGLGILSLVTLTGFVSAQVFEDSIIITARTSTGGGPGQETSYALTCRASGASSIDLYWVGSKNEPHTVRLLGAKAGQTLTELTSKTAEPAGSLYSGTGSYRHSNLASSTIYEYQLLIDYTGSRTDEREPASPISCTTLGETIGTPSNLTVWTIDSNNLYVNWKDNAVEPHSSFILERIKVTPKSPVWQTAKVETVSESELRVNWQNDTNREQYKGPYYHVIERSTSSEPFADRDKDGKYDPKTGKPLDKSFTSINVSFNEDKVYTTDPNAKNLYNSTDSGLTEATVYFYRIKGCSSILVDLTKDNTDNPETLICSNYTPSVEKNATKPAAPSNLTAVAVSTNTINLSWRDNSGGEDGFYIYQDGSQIQTKSASAGKGGTVSATVTGLSRGTTYSFTVRAYKNNPNNPNVKILSVESNAASDTTWVSLNVSKEGTGSGSVTGPGIDCGSDCTEDYEFNTVVTLTASTLTVSSTFGGWGGDCAAYGTDASCNLTMDADKSVSATFNLVVGSSQRFLANVFDLAASLFVDVKSVFGNWWQVIQNVISNAFRPTTFAQSVNLNDYFGQFRKTLSVNAYPSTYKDVNLEPETVYLYRVKAVFSDGRQTAYSNEGAGKTLPTGDVLGPVNVNICTRNSFCAPVAAEVIETPGGLIFDPRNDYSQFNYDVKYPGYGQCIVNADCRDVGTSRQFFEETR